MLMLGDFVIVVHEGAQTLGYIVDRKGSTVTAFLNGVADPLVVDAEQCALVEGEYSFVFVHDRSRETNIPRIISCSLH